MFKNLASEALGLSDIGKIIDPSDYDKTDVDDYIFAEDDEKIYVVIKSKADEYCFTNVAFIHLDGASAMSKKRTMKRYLYKHFPISDICIETAGTIDLDAELKFEIAGKMMSIDIDKKQIEQIRGIYKALFAVAEACKDIEFNMSTLQHSHDAINNMFHLRQLPEQAVLNLPDMLTQTSEQVETHFNKRRDEIRDYDFGAIFDKYLPR